VVSPLLANVYLHYVFDLWAHQWRQRYAQGEVILVRYADDFVVGFQHRSDAERFLAALRERFSKFNLELHGEKTRLIEFGRFAAENRQSRGDGKPEPFDFLGFTHVCGKTRKGRFTVVRRPMKQRMRAKLRAIKQDLWRRMHRPIPETGSWLRSVVSGWYRYYAVPLTYRTLQSFRRHVMWLWYRTLRRRSDKDRTTWPRLYRLSDRWLPTPRILHAYPSERLCVTTQGRSRMR